MAALKLYFDTRAPRKDGRCPLKIAVSHKGSFLINLKVYMTPDEFSHQTVIRDNTEIIAHPPGRKTDAAYINQRMLQAKARLLELSVSGRLPRLSNAELKREIEGSNPSEDEKNGKPLRFMERYRAYTQAISRPNTLSTYHCTLRKIAEFTNPETLTFEQMTYAWLKDFDTFMQRQGMKPNARSIYLRNIRTLFNDAIDRELLPLNLYPFRRFKMPKEATPKRSLTIEQLRCLRDYECEEYQRQYRDIFMLIFYLGGINVVDLCHLKELRNGYIEYRRAKTGRLYKIKAEPEAVAIIERYRGKEYLLDILDRYKDYRNYLHRLDRNLAEIGPVEIVKDKVGRLRKKRKTGLFPGLSSYWARHTWATIAAGLEIPKETIAATLGHGGNDVTDIYIRFDQKKIDRAIRCVIDAVNGDTEAENSAT